MQRVHIIANLCIPGPPSVHQTDAFTCKAFGIAALLYDGGHDVTMYGTDEQSAEAACTRFVSIGSTNDLYGADLIRDTDNFRHPFYMMPNESMFSDQRYKVSQRTMAIVLDRLAAQVIQGDTILWTCSEPSVQEMKESRVPEVDIVHAHAGHFGGVSRMNHIAFATKPWMEYFLNDIKQQPLKTAAVIHPWANHAAFNFGATPEPKTVLFMARVLKCKGIRIVEAVAKEMPDWTFLVAGGAGREGDDVLILDDIPNGPLCRLPNVKYLGIVTGDARLDLLSRATVLLQPTEYFEPCGLNVMEAMLSGTPAVVPAFGGFMDFIDSEKTGCVVPWGQLYSDAICRASRLDRVSVRSAAMALFAPARAFDQYTAFITAAHQSK